MTLGPRVQTAAPVLVVLVAVACLSVEPGLAGQAPRFEVTDLTSRPRVTFLVFGDAGTGGAGQYRVGAAMGDVCRERSCDFALMLGDNLYEDGVEVNVRDDAAASHAEILGQFALKFEKPYASLAGRPGFHVWAVAGNHDYERHALLSQVTYSEFSRLWRMPAPHYLVPRLPSWVEIQAIHTDTDIRRDLNGLQVSSIRRDLCAAGGERWKLAFGHHPVYNSGHHGGDGNERRVRALLEPVLRECGVHLYFSGHAHHQEHLTAPGFEQVIQGAAGKSKGSNSRRSGPGLRQRFFSRTFGFAVVELDAARIRMDFYDVVNTREKAASWTPPTAAEVVRSYSWCAARGEVGRAEREPSPCPAGG